MKLKKITPTVFTFLLLSGLTLFGSTGSTTEASEASDEEARIKEVLNKLNLPGVRIDIEGFIDVDAQVAMEYGMLELVACTEGTKEHESIVRVNAKAAHIHAALLLVGAQNGNPAMRRPINEEMTRWTHIPPSGSPVEVSLVVEGPDGKPVERPISDFIRKNLDNIYEPGSASASETTGEADGEAFPNSFLFTGSQLVDARDGSRRYLADTSGHVITISTFGDEMLGLPGFQSRVNGELIWELDTTHLPALDEKVTLRLRPVFESAEG